MNGNVKINIAHKDVTFAAELYFHNYMFMIPKQKM